MSAHYDVVVLGAGPGGYVAAIRAAQLGLSTAIVEQKYWGGVCLNVGCIPSKALLRNAELAHIFTKEAKLFGISGEASFDFGAAFDRSRKVADGRVKGVHFLMKKNKITEYDGKGSFTDPNTIEVALSKGGSDTITFDNCIIATGTVTKLLPGTRLSDNVVTYEEQIMTRDLPGSILIVGAGAIGMEFGYVLRNYGVDVTIVEFLDRALPNEDADVSKEIAKAYKKLGIKIQTSAAVQSIDDDGAKVTVSIKDNKSGNVETVTVDKVLQAVGFAPRVEGYGLENTGVALERGAIVIDDVDAHQRAAHLRDRRRHREAAARARRRGPGRRRGGDDRRGGDPADRRLPDDAARDVLPAAGRQLRPHRGSRPAKRATT